MRVDFFKREILDKATGNTHNGFACVEISFFFSWLQKKTKALSTDDKPPMEHSSLRHAIVASVSHRKISIRRIFHRFWFDLVSRSHGMRRSPHLYAQVPDFSIAKLYPVEDNYVAQTNGKRSPKSLAELATDALCRALPLLDGELPVGLPQDVVDDVVQSLIRHSALNATTLKVLRQCPLAELSLAGCRGVSDEWLAPFRSSSPPALDSSDDSMELNEDNEDIEAEEETFFSSSETKNSSDHSSCSTETFCSAVATSSSSPPLTPMTIQDCSTIHLTLLDLRGSQRVTDDGLLQLTHLYSLRVARLDNCHSILGPGLAAFTEAHQLHTVSLDNCRRLTDEGIWQLSHLVALENLSLSGCRCLTDSSLEAMSDLYNVRKLDLSQCDLISNQGLGYLEKMERLEELSLGWCRSVSDGGLSILANQAGKSKHLRTLRLARCNLTDDGLNHLGKLMALEEVDLNGCHRLSSMATGQVLARLPLLAVLDVSYCPNILYVL
jgi:hypothetical protein